MIIDGKRIAQEIVSAVREGGVPGTVVRAIAVSPTLATLSYLRIKERAAEAAGMKLEVVRMPDEATTEEVIEEIRKPGAHAVIVQLPLPSHVDEEKILNAIPPELDADVLSSKSRAQGILVAPVACAVEEILSRASIDPQGKRVVVIGKGWLVGEPVARYLTSLGAHVSSYDIHTFSPEVLKDAEIVVSGAGVPRLVQSEMLTEGVALIDAGTSEDGGTILGDIDPVCAALASVYTPVPGGVGPVTVACLFQNIAHLRKANIQVH